MDFPQFQVPIIGHGMVIGLNAITHVILSHGIAIGVVFFIVLIELIGFIRKDERYDRFGHFAVVPTTIIISSVSAITGVGIWFTIGTLAPRASSEMLRLFFWPWFIESIDFFIEAALILAYYLLWEKMKTRKMKILHIQIGVSYVLGGLASAWLITGIIGFQLTPGQWIWEQNFWSAFFNPSLWPQTFLRFFGGLALGAILMTGLLFFWKKWEDKKALREFRRDALRVFGIGILLFGGIAYVCYRIYWGNIAPTFRINAIFAILTSHFAQSPWVLWLGIWLAVGMIGLLALVNVAGVRLGAKILIIPALLGAIALTAGFERMREFIRGPYVMASYMYASEWTAKETALLKTEGMLDRMYWPAVTEGALSERQQGQALFGHNCTTCHTIGGLNDIRDRVRGRTEDGIAAIINHTREMVPWMPPFAGTDRERRIMAAYLFRLAQERPAVIPSRFPQHKEPRNE